MLQERVEMGRREKFLTLRRINRIKFECLATFNAHATDNLKARVFREKLNLRHKSFVFSALFSYRSYSQYFTEKENNLISIHNGHTLRKFFNRLVCWRLQRQFDKASTSVVHKMRA